MRFPSMSGLGLFAIGILALAGGCHLIVGIRDAEPYPPAGGAGGAGGAAACTPEQTQDCYGGPEQTKGVGACKVGTQTCQADGEWGPCEGEVLPGTEDCSQASDEDCNGYACSETLWVKQFGDQSTNASVEDVEVDPQTGDIYFTGWFQGLLPIGSDTLDSQGSVRSAYLAKFDRDGAPLWAKQFGIGFDSQMDARSVTLDGQGNVILVGDAYPTVNLGGNDLPTGAFVGKFTSSGQHVWSESCQCDTGFDARGAVDPSSGDVVVAGRFATFGTGTITCGNSPVTGTSDVFVAKLAASDGSALFSKAFNGTGLESLEAVAVDKQGSIVIAGYGSDLSFGGTPLTGAYIAKLASNGSHVWSKAIGVVTPRGLSCDAVGGIAITGSGSGTNVLNLGGTDLPPIGHTDMFVARLDEFGNHVWSRRFGSPGFNKSRGSDVALDSGGNIAVAGEVQGNVPIDDLILAGDFNSFVAKFGTNGKVAWAKTLGGPEGASESQSVAFSSQDELVFGGQFSVAADFGEGLVIPMGESDLVLLKIAP